jgi:hypothetical protein
MKTALASALAPLSSEDGAFVLPSMSTTSDNKVMALYFFNSGFYIANGDYDNRLRQAGRLV